MRNSIDLPDQIHLKISEISNIEYWEVPSDASTQYLSHGYFRYIGKFPPQLVHKFIQDYGTKGGLLIDTMCGGGTSLIEAGLNDMSAIGGDINETALLISRVSTKSLDPTLLKQAYDNLETKLSELELDETPIGNMIKKVKKGVNIKRDLYGMEHYFDEKNLFELITIENLIKGITDKEIAEFFTLAVASIIRLVSKANVKKMNTEIDEDKVVKPVVPTFRKQVQQMLSVNELLWEMKYPRREIKVIKANAEDTGLNAGIADLVVLHPPYLSGTAFSESVQLQLAWLGVNHKTLRVKELAMRGSYFHKPDGLRKYLVGWNNVLKESYRLLKDKKYCAVVIGDGSTESVRFPMDILTCEFAKDMGFEVVKVARQLINHNTGRTLNKKMKYQHVIIFKK